MSKQDVFDWFDKLGDGFEALAEDQKIEFALQMERMMKLKGIKKKELAEMMGASPAYVSKVLRGDKNLTIESMAKLAWNIGADLHLCLSDPNADWYPLEVYSRTEQKGEKAKVAQLWKSSAQNLAA